MADKIHFKSKTEPYKWTVEAFDKLIASCKIELNFTQRMHLYNRIVSINSHNLQCTRNWYVSRIIKLTEVCAFRKNICRDYAGLKFFLMKNNKELFDKWYLEHEKVRKSVRECKK